MIAVDTNLLVYAHREDSEFHEAALRELVALAQSGKPWSIPYPCIHEFIAIVTHPRIYSPPTPLRMAFEAIEAWLETPYCRALSEEPGYISSLREIAIPAKAAGPMIHDARISALCRQHGVSELWTADRDFSRFKTPKTRNPLV